MCPSRRSNTQQLGAGGGASHHGAQGHGRRRARGTHLCGVLANSAGGLQRLERHQGTEPAHWDHIVPDLATARLRGKALDANSRSMLQLVDRAAQDHPELRERDLVLGSTKLARADVLPIVSTML